MSCHWLTMREAADYLRVTKGTISRWISLGKLPAFISPIGGKGKIVRICIRELEKFGGVNLDSEAGKASVPNPDTAKTAEVSVSVSSDLHRPGTGGESG